MALTVVFLVKPPILPVDIAKVKGKFTEKAFAKQYPMKRAQTLSVEICRAIPAPAIERAILKTIQYVRLFSNQEHPAVER